MKVTQYLRIERAIAATAKSDIRERWIYGLRLLRDPDAFAPGSSQLKPGRADELVRSAKAAGYPLTTREIQFRLQCARAYPTETQITNAGSQFESWTELRAAGFPPFEAPDGEPPADHRNETERLRDHARAMALLVGEQASLFPVADFEPSETPLKSLKAYALEMAELTERFRKRDTDRLRYIEALIEAADGDLSVTWQDAHRRAYGEDVAE